MSEPTPAFEVMSLAQLEPAERIFRHVSRPSWGRAVLVGLEQSRRRFHFEDGQTRIFKEGFWHFLERVPAEEIDVKAVFNSIVGAHETTSGRGGRSGTKSPREPLMSFEDQIKAFEHAFPGGFLAEPWTDAVRAPRAGAKWLKRHQDSGLHLAKEILAEDRLRAALAEGNDEAVLAGLVHVLKATGLVSKPHSLTPLAALTGEDRLAVTTAAVTLLYDEDQAYLDRFGAWLSTLRSRGGLAPLWPMATALSAIVHPTEQVLVRHRYTELQARLFEPNIPVPNRPERRGYEIALRVTLSAQESLEAAGHEPRDLLDVSSFMWHTLRPSALQYVQSLSAPQG